MNLSRILKWDLAMVLVVVLVILIVAGMILDYKAHNRIEQLENDANAMDSLLTSYQASLASCRADRDTLAYTVFRGLDSILDALPRSGGVGYVEVTK